MAISVDTVDGKGPSMGIELASSQVASDPLAVGTILTYRPIRNVDGYAKAILSDFSKSAFGESFRGLGLIRASVWLQKDPAAALIRWEGTDMETLVDRSAASTDPIIAKWRGLMRVYSDPSVVESYWDASRHGIFSWSSGEEGRESEMMVLRNPPQVEGYIRNAIDCQNDPALFAATDRIRRRQGFTRIESWYQKTEEESVLLALMEGDDLKAALARMFAENNEMDRRLMEIGRSMALGPSALPVTAKLLAHWHA